VCLHTDLTDVQCIKTSLPVRIGSFLLVRRVLSLASSTFLPSAADTRDLQDMIMSKRDVPVNSAVDNVFEQWAIAHGQSGALPPVSLSYIPVNTNIIHCRSLMECQSIPVVS